MKVSGLATGMDTETIIRDLMNANRIPLDKITQKKQYMEWVLDDYRSINRDLRATSDKLFDTIMRESTFMAKTVNVSDSDAVGVKNVNSTSEFAGSIQVHKLATQSTLQSSDKIAALDGKSENNTLGELGINKGMISVKAPGSETPVDVKYESTDTLKSLLEKINKQTGVNAFYDSQTGKIALTAKSGGSSKIEVTSDGTDGMDAVSVLKLAKLDDESNSKAGNDAEITINGLRTTRSSNTFQINGFEISLKQVTAPFEEDGKTIKAGEKTVTFNSAPDADKVVDAVTQFVNDYNKMIEDLNAKIREPKHRSFQPLSAEEKKDMKENEIKLWEEKAMSGTLRNDPEISNMLTKLRAIMSSSVMGTDGKNITLKDLGITASTSYTENGKLTINETKLRKAIADNPNKVYELFAKPTVESKDPKVAVKGGLANQFRAVVDSSRKAISAKAGSVGSVNDSFTLGRSLKDMDKQIERFEERMKMTESRLWKQFSAMESAIQRLNAQSASLMSSFGGA